MYEWYIRSEGWKQRRADFIAKHKTKLCERCKAPGVIVHHRNYETLGSEGPRCLVLLCAACHDELHKKFRQDRRGRTLWDFTTDFLRRDENHKTFPKTSAKRVAINRKRAARTSVRFEIIAASKTSAKADRLYRDGKLGKFGAASEVRRIDPSEWHNPEQVSVSR